MSTMEITLLVIGVIIFALSFIIPDRKKDSEGSSVDPETIRKMMEGELNGMKLKVNEATDETVEYSIEKAERQLERVSNEKLMALSEYADTIMGGIDKSHQELLFMYDMLNDKQTDLKNTVRKAEATVREVEATPIVAPASNTVAPAAGSGDFQSIQAQPVAFEQNIIPQAPVMVQQASTDNESFAQMVSAGHTVEEYLDDSISESANNNDKIIEMSKKGMSTVDIARELGLGVGEVKLVIDLFKD